MKCGICGKTTMRGYYGEGYPIYDRGDLAQHKKYEHKAEYRAAIEARRTKAEIAKAEAQRVSDARLAASRPVVYRSFGQGEPETYPSSKVTWQQVKGWDGQIRTDVRFPDAQAYEEYKCVMVEIAGLEAHASVILTRAWELGTPVTLEHLDELDRAAAQPAAEGDR